MEIIQVSAVAFSYEDGNRPDCRTVFKVRCGSRAEVEELAGAVGGDFPFSASGNALARNGGYLVSAFAVIPEGENIWRLEFSGRRRADGCVQTGEVFGITGSGDVESRSAVFVVPASGIAQFQPEIGGAAEWAGENFYCTACEVSELAGGEIRMKVTARKVDGIRLLSVSSEFRHLGFSLLGVERCDRIWHSVWSVPAAELDDFPHATGASAESWAEPDTQVVRLERRRLSPVEYEITLEAHGLFGSGDPLRLYQGMDDRSDLGNRVDIEAEFSELIVSCEEAGWRRRADGGYDEIADWSAVRCPLAVAAGERFSGFERPLRSMTARETRYYQGEPGDNLGTVAAWYAAGPIYSGKVGSYSAEWLRSDIRSSGTVDNRGRSWTKIERCYRLPPDGQSWNPNYWSNR